MSITVPVSPYYKSLVVCGKRLRSQWHAEADIWFPEAAVEIVEAAKLTASLKKLEARALTEDKPMVAIVSYQTVASKGNELASYFVAGDDLVVDEAAVLKNPNSQRCKALWELREHFARGLALTGTPIEKDLDDMGNILAWVRGDRSMFHGIRLTKRFPDVSDKAQVAKLWDALGPTVFRRDRSEIADELPKIQTETILLDPEPAELKLADAARRHLKKILEDLTAKVDALAAADPEDPKVAAARDELKSLRGAALGGVTLARMAACDPIAVQESKSVGAALLDAEGLVKPAVKTGGTKRQQIVGLAKDLIASGESVLIFTDFSTVADHLVADLKAGGIRVGCIKGGMTDKAASDAQDGFQGGIGGTIGADVRYDCLVLTKAAKEGLNLQRATVLIHYDLPWLPSDMVQRVGRASRIGSTADTLQVLIPVMAGTIEERAAKKLVSRAVTALAVLDDPRGVDSADTEVGQALAGLAGVISDGEIEDGEEGLLEMARSLIG